MNIADTENTIVCLKHMVSVGDLMDIGVEMWAEQKQDVLLGNRFQNRTDDLRKSCHKKEHIMSRFMKVE